MKTNLKAPNMMKNRIGCIDENHTIQTSILPLLREDQNQAVQILSGDILPQRVVSDAPHAPSRLKSAQHHGLTIGCNHRVVRTEDNKLKCSVCGQNFPATSEGGIDLDQYAREIALRPFRQWR